MPSAMKTGVKAIRIVMTILLSTKIDVMEKKNHAPPAYATNQESALAMPRPGESHGIWSMAAVTPSSPVENLFHSRSSQFQGDVRSA